jgi:hypothetical protein
MHTAIETTPARRPQRPQIIRPRGTYFCVQYSIAGSDATWNTVVQGRDAASALADFKRQFHIQDAEIID